MDKVPVELAALIAEGWLDGDFKRLLKTNPTEAFDRFGLKYEDYSPFTLPPNPNWLVISKDNLLEDKSENIIHLNGYVNVDNNDCAKCTTSLYIFEKIIVIDDATQSGHTDMLARPGMIISARPNSENSPELCNILSREYKAENISVIYGRELPEMN